MGLPDSETFAFADFHGEVLSHLKPGDLEGEIRRLIDPAAAAETIHWGRNYLYKAELATPGGPVEVVVKQFRNKGLRARALRHLRGTKAQRSFRAARAFQAAGLPTAEAVLLVESTPFDGPAFFITRHLPGVTEARYLLRAANAGREQQDFPGVDFELFLTSLGQTLRRMHDHGIFHRDLSIGNVLLTTTGGRPDLYIVDLNRARFRRRLGLSQRTRDLCRLALHRRQHQQLLLDAYWGTPAGGLRTGVYRLYTRGFHTRIESKKKLRAATNGFQNWLRPRTAHAHIPEAPAEASARDKIVWDHLSDQPHQHASRFEKLLVRLADTPDHARQATATLAALPRIWRRYRQLRGKLPRREVPWGATGIGLRPLPEAPEALLDAIDDLGVETALLRLHPWDDDHRAEEDLARALTERGLEVAFALPQNRDLVRDPSRWRHKIEELAERFTPYGRQFQVGQAINRSKWGVWSYAEYLRLASSAAEILRRYPEVEILGPGVIDFEFHSTIGVVNRRDLDVRFDALASLLYVDRRGAPENSQAGFDTVDKVILLQAIAETARNCAPRSWITEVNWPLREGPHSPAGRGVSVDEEAQADYLARYFLLALTTGGAERAYWWQMVARGYGLTVPLESESGLELRRRPAFAAFATLVRQLRGTVFVEALEAPSDAFLFLFRSEDGGHRVAGWGARGRCRARLPRPARSLVERDGQRSNAPESLEIELSPSVQYFELAPQ